MRKLISAGLTRMRGDGTFQKGLLCMAALGVYMPLVCYINAVRGGYEQTLDSCLFPYAVFIVIVAAVFCSLFLGAEYGDGAIRNKLVVGHGRSSVYLSNLFVNAVACIAMQAAYLVFALALGLPLLGMEAGVAQLIALMGCALMMSLAFVAIFTLIGMLCQNKAVVAVVCVLGAFVLLFVGAYLSSRLDEPEIFDGYVFTDSTGTMISEQEPNPNYLSGAKREAYLFLLDFLPGGQSMQIAGRTAERPARLMLYALIVITLTTAAGVCIFQKKDIK